MCISISIWGQKTGLWGLHPNTCRGSQSQKKHVLTNSFHITGDGLLYKIDSIIDISESENILKDRQITILRKALMDKRN